VLLSMTGFGEASRPQRDRIISVEIRAINSRYFKLTTRLSDGYASLESFIESALRNQIKRGTVQVNLRVDQLGAAEGYRLNEAVLAGYFRQLEAFQNRCHSSEAVSIGDLLALPGVIETQAGDRDAAADWPLIEPVVHEALERLSEMRRTEGLAMAADLGANLDAIGAELRAIQARAPQVVDAYRERLAERLNKLLSEYDVRVQAADIIREVGIFAERGDIAEEIVRLGSHLDQFRECMALTESAGRKLEFVTQEMFRETNTIGSKSSDAEISRRVVEIKTAIERIREMVQNIE
jgi:uncharacterized protein (TIGR00255 family)